MRDVEVQWKEVQAAIEQSAVSERVVQHTKFIRDDEIELYFKAADVLVLPYTQIFQSGVLFMSYSFGLPVIGTDVGSFAHDIIEGETGFVCRSADSEDLARVIEAYFSSDLFRELDEKRARIKDFIQASHSWEKAGRKTVEVYGRLAHQSEPEYSA